MASLPQTLTFERAHEVLKLDVETGALTWRIRTGSRCKMGDRAGSFHKRSGYRFILIDGRKYREHILIWFMLHGEWRHREVDHHDRDRANNKPSNLRLADETLQRANTAVRCDSKLGVRGVHLHKASGLYMARVTFRGSRFTKYFRTMEEAAVAARDERLRVFGQFAPAYDQHQGA